MKTLGRMRGFLLALALAVTWCASAEEESYIYWMVDWEPVLDESPLTGSANARFMACSDSGELFYLTPYAQNYSSGGLTPVELVPGLSGEAPTFRIDDLTDDGPRYTLLDGHIADDIRYYVELINDSGDIIGRSVEGIGYSTAFDAGMVLQWDGKSQIYTPSDPWSVSTFVSVPEPNSALLMVLGLALVALRRRTHTHA